MDAKEQKLLAEKLREQSLADLLIARANLGQTGFRLGDVRINRNHVVISKCQQSAEKLLKSYFLWHGDSVNPFHAHRPMQNVLAGTGGETPRLQKFRATVRQEPNGLLQQIMWLENLAPAGAPAGVANLSAINASDLGENTEYPFFCTKRAEIVFPAEYFEERQSIGAVRAAYLLCKVIANSDDTIFGNVIVRFVLEYPLDREI
jgi:hypothetical protein